MAEITEETFNPSIDSFAKIVKEGFDAVDKRFDAVDKRFDAVDKRFDAVECVMREHQAEVKLDIARLDDRIDQLSTHVDAFIQLHQKLDIELTALRHKYDLLATRVAKLEGTPA